jgi:Fe-S-cluster containining protein
LESTAFLHGLVELLEAKGLIQIEELDQKKTAAAERLTRKLEQQGEGVALQTPEYDKYAFQSTVEIDCPSRLPLCHAACCRLPFPLSKQDIREGVIEWDLGHPYVIAQGPGGYCVHLNQNTQGCSVHAQRPVPCRAYDCRKESRIWLDFENGVINPAVLRSDWPYCLDEQTEQP